MGMCTYIKFVYEYPNDAQDSLPLYMLKPIICKERRTQKLDMV